MKINNLNQKLKIQNQISQKINLMIIISSKFLLKIILDKLKIYWSLYIKQIKKFNKQQLS